MEGQKSRNRGAKRKKVMNEFVRVGVSISPILLEKYGREKLLSELHTVIKDRISMIERSVVETDC